MCYECEYGNNTEMGYMFHYRCSLLNNQISEIVNTYFNTRESMMKCPLE